MEEVAMEAVELEAVELKAVSASNFEAVRAWRLCRQAPVFGLSWP